MKQYNLTTGWLLRPSFLAAVALVSMVGSVKAADYPSTVLADNPVLYYRFEELPGSMTASNAATTGAALDGTYVYNTAAVVPELGLPGLATNSIGFLGSSTDYGYVDIPFDPLLSPVAPDGLHGAPFSVECWAQSYTAVNAAYLSMLGMHGTYGAAPYGNASGFLLGQTPPVDSTTPPQWLFVLRNGAFLNTGAVTPLQWTYLVGVFDGTNGYFYINGALATFGASGGYLADPSSDGSVGIVPNAGIVPSGPYAAWNGQIDELAMYTNALTLTQITNHYAVGLQSIRVAATPPNILTQPMDATNFSGTKVSFSVVAGGSAPLSYRWNRVGTGPIPNATNSTYTFTSVYPNDNGAGFFVTITNSVGSTNSDTATLTVQTDITIAGPPFSITREVGSYAAFRMAAGGALPLGYQWSVSTNNGSSFSRLLGQTSDTLWLTNVQSSQNNNLYAVVATNPFTSYSNSATLTVIARATNETFSGYSAIVVADKPVAYWRLDESTNSTTATDCVGSFDGTYDNSLGPIVWGIPTGVPHYTDPGVDLQDPQTTIAGQGGVVRIPYALELNPWGPWSVEAWIRPDAVDGVFRVPLSSMQNINFGNSVYGWLIYEYGSIPSFWTAVIYNGTASGIFGTDFNPGQNPTAGQWSYMVIADDGTNITFYVNGQVAFATTVGASGYTPQGINGDPSVAGQPTIIGQRSDAAFFGGNAGTANVAIYNYALTPRQIQTHFQNTVSLTITRSGNNVVLSWPFGTLQSAPVVTGTYTNIATATSPYTNATSQAETFYRVKVQ